MKIIGNIFCLRDLSDTRYVYFCGDAIIPSYIRQDNRLYLFLIIIGITEDRHKEFVVVENGYQESEKNLTELINGINSLRK
ncbi:MAG: hypothetical protein ACTS73_03845 [Arsenophonus sp. NEOnobi-MAG3]